MSMDCPVKAGGFIYKQTTEDDDWPSPESNSSNSSIALVGHYKSLSCP